MLAERERPSGSTAQYFLLLCDIVVVVAVTMGYMFAERMRPTGLTAVYFLLLFVVVVVVVIAVVVVMK